MSGTARTKVTPTAEDVRVKMLCFHEAGHAVVGHQLGWELLKMTSHGFGQAHFKPVAIPNVLFASDDQERARCIEVTRAAMAVVTAGPVAAFIHYKEARARGFSCGKEARAYRRYEEWPISGWFSINRPDDNPHSDYALAVREANHIVQVQHPVQSENYHEAILKELRAAEAVAQAILKRSWAAVSDIALSLHKAKSGQLNRRQLLARFEKHGVNVLAA